MEVVVRVWIVEVGWMVRRLGCKRSPAFTHCALAGTFAAPHRARPTADCPDSRDSLAGVGEEVGSRARLLESGGAGFTHWPEGCLDVGKAE